MEVKYKILVNYLKDLIGQDEVMEEGQYKLICRYDIIRILKALEEVE